MSFFLTLGLITPAFHISVKAEALEVANSACTLADMIFSYCASGGVAITNQTVIDEVYNVLGTSYGTLQTFVDNGLLTYSNGQYVDSGLSTNLESTLNSVSSIDIGALFNQTAEQNPAGVALSGAGSLAGIAGSVASTGVLPIGVGIAVSGYCGFQIGNIIANMAGLYGQRVDYGMPITTPQDMINMVPAGGTCQICEPYIAVSNGPSICCIIDTGTYPKLNIIYGYDISPNQTRYVNTYDRQTGRLRWSVTNIYNQKSAGIFEINMSSANKLFSPSITFSSREACDAYWNKYNNGEIGDPKITSPDIIGTNGNVTGNYDSESGKYTIPEAATQVNPENQSVNPTSLNKDDWLNYANLANSNYTNGNPELNTDIYNDILDAIRINSPNPNPDPEPDPNPNPDPDPNPDPNPETVPLPDVNPYPDTYPVADPETVPDDKEQPQYTEKATENETDITTGDPYTTPDLLDKFPFCIPRDILRAFKKLDSGSREAPHIQWRFHPNEMIDYTFDVDFSTWNNVAVLLRLLELIAFIVLLGIATRNLILS